MEKQLKLMQVLEATEAIMCEKYDYAWEDMDSDTGVSEQYQAEYDKYYQQFYNLVHNGINNQ